MGNMSRLKAAQCARVRRLKRQFADVENSMHRRNKVKTDRVLSRRRLERSLCQVRDRGGTDGGPLPHRKTGARLAGAGERRASNVLQKSENGGADRASCPYEIL
jgi:hypothetical protein